MSGKILNGFGVSAQVGKCDLRGGESVDRADAEDAKQALNKYRIDRRSGLEFDFDPVIGRSVFAARFRVAASNKNNPVLIGTGWAKQR